MSHYITAILLASGEGSRFKEDIPKQFHLLSGKKIYLYALETFLQIEEIKEILLVAHKQWFSLIKEDLRSFPLHTIRLVEGGQTRQASSYKGLLACSTQTSHVIIHDAVRPFVTKAILKENIFLATKYQACDTCTSSYDTIVHSKEGLLVDHIPPRSQYLRGQTPQSFAYDLIKKAHETALFQGITDATDDCQLVLQLSHPVRIAKGSDENIKITTFFDLLLAEQLLRLQLTSLTPCCNTDLQGKTFVITGATGGIGKQLRLQLEKAGACVIPLSRTTPDPVDLTCEQEVKNIFAKIFATYGAIDGLINAIGYLKIEPLQSLSSQDIQELIHTNFTSVVYTCKYCRVKNGGHILNLASSSYTKGRPLYSIYSAMKAALVNFTQGLAEEYSSLCVNSIVPSRTDTPMRKKNFPTEDPALLLSPSEVASSIVQALQTHHLTGITIEIKK